MTTPHLSTIHCLGPAGTFSHEAAEVIFPGTDIRFASNFDMLFDMLDRDAGSVGVAPIENSLHGSVDEVLDLLKETSVRIWRTHDVAIKHAFGAVEPAKVRKIASHPQALRQCRKWLKEHYPDAEHFPVSSTAYAAGLAEKDALVGAIASEKLLTKAGLQIIARDVEGEGNTTRFGIVAAHDPFPDAVRTQMSIVLHPTDDHPGLLHRLLTPFKIYDVNMTRIESRPTGQKLGDYIFFVDFVGGRDDSRTQKVFDELKQVADVQILGEW